MEMSISLVDTNDFYDLDFLAEFDILVRRCFAFDETETSIQLVDDRGCAIERLISNFQYDKAAGTAHATIRSMFRYFHRFLTR
jgi:hypothetical protein